MKTYFIALVLLLLGLNSMSAQYNYSTNTAHISVLKAIGVTNDVIKARTEDFEKKAALKPLFFLNTKTKIGELNRLSNNLSYYIEDLQKEANTERILFDLLEEDFYEKVLFDAEGSLNPKGKKLKVKIDSLYRVSKQINIHGLSQLSNFSDAHFNTTKDYADTYGKKLDYFENLFYDRSNYGIMMSMYFLLLDVKTFELLYFQTVMSF